MMIKRLFLGLALVFFVSSVSALGITPAIRSLEYVQGQEVNITFQVLDAVQGVVYDVIVRSGDLFNGSYANVDSVTGPESFVVTVKIPYGDVEPGPHYLGVSVKERPSETSFINTVVEVGAVVKTFVPYPGFYGDLSLNIPDGNLGDQIPVEFYVINRGDNPLDIKTVYVDFTSLNGISTKRLDFTPVVIPVAGDRYFRKYLDTNGMNAGDYIGTAKVEYEGLMREVNKSFRVGSLFVNISNYTDYIVGKGIQKFYVTLESRWNSPIYGAYVDVNLSNEFYSTTFRTPSVDLIPWEKKEIESFLETEDLEGVYNLFLNASYHGKSSVAYGTLLIGRDYSLAIYLVSFIIAILFFVVLYFLLRKFFFKGKKR